MSTQQFRAALDLLAHRGPDGEGVWWRPNPGPSVVLGHRRLSILDLGPAAAQPMAAVDGLEVLVFNGEIYNFVELRERLRGLGHSFASNGDTEVLLCAYRQWGAECTVHLNGMFAFVIWDERRRRLFAARDRFGEKPFYYVWDESAQRFAFASEIKSLVALGVVRVDIDDLRLAQYVRSDALDGSNGTLLRGVQRLEAAHTLQLIWSSTPHLVKERYWSLPVERQDVQLDVAAARVAELFRDSVRLRLRADVPVGTSLSGGLDSSAVVCQIHQLGADAGQRTFSARMADPKLDEGYYIDEVLREVQVEAHSVMPQSDELPRDFDRMCWHMEEPFPATSMYAQYLVMRLAASHSTTVLLDGQGADEILAGYGHYVRLRWLDLLAGGRWLTLQRERRTYRSLRGGTGGAGVPALLADLLPGLRRMLGRDRPQRAFDQWWDPSFLGANSEPADPEAPSAGSRMDRALRWDSTCGPLQSLLRYGDRNSMAWSREVRQPFLDHRLAEYIVSLPDAFKVGEGVTKRVMRAAMKGIVPAVILNRHDKLGYQAPMGAWFAGSLRPWVFGKLEQARDELRGRLAGDLLERFSKLETIGEWSNGRHLMRLMTLAEGLHQLRSCLPPAHSMPKALA